MCSGSAGCRLEPGRGAWRTSTALGGEVGGAERGRFPRSTRPGIDWRKAGTDFPHSRFACPYCAEIDRAAPYRLPSRSWLRSGKAPGQRPEAPSRASPAVTLRHGTAAVDRAEPVAHPLAELRGELPRVRRRVPAPPHHERRVGRHGDAQSAARPAARARSGPRPTPRRPPPTRRRPRRAARASGTPRAPRPPRAPSPRPAPPRPRAARGTGGSTRTQLAPGA